MRRLTCLTSVVVLAAALSAQAQDAAAPPGPAMQPGQASEASPANVGPQAPDPAALIRVPIRAFTLLSLPDMQPVPVDFDLRNVAELPPIANGVTLRGWGRAVPVEDIKVGQAVLTTVAKDDVSVIIEGDGLMAQFDTDSGNLTPETVIEAEGDRQKLLDALAKLEELLAEEDEEKEEKPKKEKPEPEQAESRPSGNAAQNSQASGYKTPERLPEKKEDPAPPEPVVDVKTTTEGCSVRIDMAQKAAIPQAKVQTFENGKLTKEEPCSDGLDRYPLEKSYASCPDDELDLAAMTATAQFRWYYVGSDGARKEVTECEPDPEKVFAIQETEEGCSVYIDFSNMQAVPRARLVYLNEINRQIEPRGCETSTLTAAVPLTPQACGFRHDFPAGRSEEMGTHVYTLGGLTYQASACSQTGRTFNHEVVYMNAANNYVCDPIVDVAGGTVTLQSRKRIIVDGAAEWVSECTPDVNAQALAATTEGCSNANTWTHDIASGVSYGQHRFYYLKGGSTREYVTQCQDSGVLYTHSQQTVGYQNHDSERMAYPLSTVTITLDDGSTYTVANSQVLAGSPQIPYTFDRQTQQENGQVSYQGCDGIYQRDRVDIYDRPDSTEASYTVGAGTPVTRGVCVSSTQYDTALVGTATSAQRYCGNVVTGEYPYENTFTLIRENYQRTVRTNPNTGEVFAESWFKYSQSVVTSDRGCSTYAAPTTWTSWNSSYGYFHSGYRNGDMPPSN